MTAAKGVALDKYVSVTEPLNIMTQPQQPFNPHTGLHMD